MTGFFKGLFGSKSKSEDTTVRSSQSDSSGSYYLDSDSAKSLGNLDYMRSVKTIRRTFPKVEGDKKEEVEKIKKVSSMSQSEGNGIASPSDSTNSPTPTNSNNPQITTERRKNDTSMDIFRTMAKDIKR